MEEFNNFGAGSRQGKPWWLLVFRGEIVVCETKFIN